MSQWDKCMLHIGFILLLYLLIIYLLMKWYLYKLLLGIISEFFSNGREAWTIPCVKVFGAILVRIFPHLNWTWRDKDYLSVFSLNAKKIGARITPNRALYTQWFSGSRSMYDRSEVFLKPNRTSAMEFFSKSS